MYRIGVRKRNRRRQVLVWGLVFVSSSALIIGIYWMIHLLFSPQTLVKESAAVTTTINYKTLTKKYDEPNFTVDIPQNWQVITRPAGLYKSYTWQSSNKGTDGQQFEVYEDTIPNNFAVNRVLVVANNDDRLSLDGAVSDNCLSFTKDDPTVKNQFGAPARWQGVSFLCDQDNQQRDVVGTSSLEGINTVTLLSPTSKAKHRYFFTYTNYSISPDYSVFYNILNSFRMK